MEELSPASSKARCMCKVRIKDWSFLLMVIAYDILFLHYIVVRESKSIFRGTAFLQFRGQKIAADGVSPSGHGF